MEAVNTSETSVNFDYTIRHIIFILAAWEHEISNIILVHIGPTTNPMDQRKSWAADSRSAGHKTPRFLQNLDVRLHVRNGSPTVAISRQIKPVYIAKPFSTSIPKNI
jgi:hypothetical protein